MRHRSHFRQLLTAVVALLVGAPMASGLVAPLRVKPGQVSPAIGAGAIAGGRAADEFSLLSVVRTPLKGGGEKLVITYGDRFGKPVKGEPGFFHVALDRDSRRVVIDLAQVSRTAVDPVDLGKILSSSKFVSGSDMTMDPHDGSTNITLSLKSPVTIKVAAMAGETGRLAIEMRESGAERSEMKAK